MLERKRERKIKKEKERERKRRSSEVCGPDADRLRLISSATAAQAHRVLRIPSPWGASSRPSIIGRGDDFFLRYGDKEREAVASFDFLDDIAIHESTVGTKDSNVSSSSGSSTDQLHVQTPSTEFMRVSPL